MSRPAPTILGYLPCFLPTFVFLLPILALFIPNKLIFRTREREQLTFLKYAPLSSDGINMLRFIMSRAMDRGFTSMKIRDIAEELHMCENTARKYIDELKDNGFIITVFDRRKATTVFVLLLPAFMPLLYHSGVELVDNYEEYIANLYDSICDEYRRRFPYGVALDVLREIEAAKEAQRMEKIRKGASLGGHVAAEKRAAAKGDGNTTQNIASDTTQTSNFERRCYQNEAPSYIYNKKQEIDPPTPNESATTETIHESRDTMGDNSLSSEKPIKTVETWVDEFEKLAARREPLFPDEAPLYTRSPEGIPIFNEDPRLSAAQNASRYSDFLKLKALAKENTLKRLAKPRCVNFKKEDKQAGDRTQTRNTSARDSASPTLEEEARAYAKAHDMPEEVVIEVFKEVPEDMGREQLLEFLTKYPKMSAHLRSLCREWRRLYINGALPSQEELLWSVDAHVDHKWNLDKPQYIPDALSYLREKMWIYAKAEWTPRAKSATVTMPEYERSPEDKARFNGASDVVNKLKEHFNVATGQVYATLYSAHIGIEKLKDRLHELSSFTGTLTDWLCNVKARLNASSVFSV
ncbi:MAG: hypothetical protein IJU76_02460 [Desulfovibrionaceae bacterium]|nr:hypothetical protein [Desulfovibrionaceae bacterium]